MKLVSRKFYLTLFFLINTVLCYSQNSTIFITSTEGIKEKKEKKKPYDGKFYYTQIGFSIPVSVNGEEFNSDYYKDPNESRFADRFAFDGISINASAGFHFKKWAAIGITSGIDARINSKLAAVPVYGTLTLNPHFGGESSLLFQYGYGHVFALGRGDLSGPYSKYKLGVHISNHILLYVDITVIDFRVNDFEKVQNFSIGMDLMNFF